MNTEVKNVYKVLKGKPYPLGAAFDKKGGVNFAIFSKNCKSASIELFYYENLDTPFFQVELSAKKNKTGGIWHALITGLDLNRTICYAYRIDGSHTPETDGSRFNRHKILIDPYSRAVAGKLNWKDNESYGYDKTRHKDQDLYPSEIDNVRTAVKGVIVDDSNFDWEDDQPPAIPLNKTIIYETHVRGFTFHKTSKVSAPGTFAGIIEKIPYLKELGITAIELLPIHEFNENEIIRLNPKTGERLKNYWGYSSLSFFALNNIYSSSKEPAGAVVEFKKMVRELHKAGIEVILDVVYNHTGEGNEVGPTFSFKGIDNSIYYLLEENQRYYKNFSGCGNTLNCNHQAVKQMILDSLRYFVSEMHVDGFRFDLAAILGRSSDGEWLGKNSLLRDIQEDPILSGAKLIAEGWDASGCYKVGEFPEGWAEWNGKYRDDIRRFLKGEEGLASALATRLCGSPDLYNDDGRAPFHSINFITSHDGFTMRDLVSYNHKNNFENGENNHDGGNDNYSFNFGAEGETGDPYINRTRMRQVKNFITVLMISQGTPMILGGDEIYRTQRGNNNCYCQDNELSWYNWDYRNIYSEVFYYFKKIIALRKENPVFCLEKFIHPRDGKKHGALDFINWHGTKQNKPDWSFMSHTMAFVINGQPEITGLKNYDRRIYVAINAYNNGLDFEIPRPRKGKKWHMAVNTFEPCGGDIFEFDNMPPFGYAKFTVEARSILILIEK